MWYKAFAGQGSFSPCLLYLFFSLSTLPPFSTFVILWQCLALREKANQSDLLALKFLHRRHYRVKVADTPTCLSNLGTLQLPLVRLPPCQPVVYHKHRHLTCWTAIIKASVDIILPYTTNSLSIGDNISIASSRSSSRTGSLSVGEDTSRFNGMSEKQVEDLFEKMLVCWQGEKRERSWVNTNGCKKTRRGIHDQNVRSAMLAFPTEKKWLMVSQDMQTESSIPAPSMSTSKKSNNDPKEVDKSTPEFYIKQFLEPDMKGVTPRLVAHLAVSLRTMPLRWLQHVLDYAISWHWFHFIVGYDSLLMQEDYKWSPMSLVSWTKEIQSKWFSRVYR